MSSQRVEIMVSCPKCGTLLEIKGLVVKCKQCNQTYRAKVRITLVEMKE